MASLAEMERDLIVERTRAGLDVARQLGRKGGRKPKMTDSKIESAKKLLANGVPPKAALRPVQELCKGFLYRHHRGGRLGCAGYQQHAAFDMPTLTLVPETQQDA